MRTRPRPAAQISSQGIPGSPLQTRRVALAACLVALALLRLPECGPALRLSAAEADPNVRPLTLVDCVQAALEHNFDLKIARYSPSIASNDLHLAYADYDPTLTLGGEHGYRRDPEVRDIAGSRANGVTTTSDGFTAGVSGLLPTGGSLGLATALTDSYGNSPVIGTNGLLQGRSLFENTKGSATFLNLRQPLLRNLWIDPTRLNIRLRKVDLRDSELALRLSMMTVVWNVEQAYFDLVAARENVRVQEKALELAQTLYSQNADKVRIGVLAPLDEKQAQSQAASSQAALITAQRTFSAQENVLKNLISDHYEAEHDQRFSPTEDLLATPQVYDLQQSWNNAFDNRPDLHQLILVLERDDIQMRYFRNQLFPALDLTATYGHNALATDFGGGFNQLGSGSGPFYTIGGQLSVPITNRKIRDSLRTTRLQRDQSEQRLRQFRQTVMVQVDDAIKQAQASLRRVSATRAAREYSELALQAEQDKFRAGASTPFIVLQLQKDLTSARSDEIQALADYNKANSSLSLREGSTLRRNNINLQVR